MGCQRIGRASDTAAQASSALPVAGLFCQAPLLATDPSGAVRLACPGGAPSRSEMLIAECSCPALRPLLSASLRPACMAVRWQLRLSVAGSCACLWQAPGSYAVPWRHQLLHFHAGYLLWWVMWDPTNATGFFNWAGAQTRSGEARPPLNCSLLVPI